MVKRRTFLNRLGLGVASVFAGTPTLVGSTMKEEMPAGGGSAITRVRPLGFQWDTLDPFLFCVHHEDKFPKGNKNLGPNCSLEGRQLGQDFLIKDGFRMYHGEVVPGFPGHPHRGFETITVVREGMVDHADSMGAAGRYGDGDVQWMTAGKGIQHSEMFPLLSEEQENPLELFQIWLNLPKKSKMVNPHFKMLWNEAIPRLSTEDPNGNTIKIEIIAGELEGAKAPAPPPNSWAHPEENYVAVWNVELSPNASWKLPAAIPGLNRTIYFYKGPKLSVDGSSLKPYHAADLLSDRSVMVKNGQETSKLLILQGKPISEPVVQHGPFVMNTRQEIQQAFYDYQQTQFGGWPWPRRDQTHGKTKGRFAKHSDGRLEEKS